MFQRIWLPVFPRAVLQGSSTDVSAPLVTPARVLRSCLIDLGLVSYPGRKSSLPPCYVSSMPDENDSAVRIKDVAGRSFGRQARDGKANIHYGVLLTIRMPDVTGVILVNAIATAMDQRMFPIHTQLPEDGSGHDIQNVQRISQIIDLGEELGKKRQLWSINARMAFQSSEPTIA